jgi:uroporphyrinogen-III synthase
MKRILLTRSEEENRKLASKLDNFEVISSPMIYYKDLPVDWQEFKRFSHLIITSKYAARLVSKHYPHKVSAYVVGEESANILNQNSNVTLGDVFDNIGDLMNRDSYGQPGFPRDNGRILYLSGNHITLEIPNVTRKEIYYTEYAASLNPQISEAPIDYVLIYSKNSADNLIKLLGNHNLLQNIQNSVSISLSENLAILLQNYVFDSLYPEKPIADDMIKLLLVYERKERPSKDK